MGRVIVRKENPFYCDNALIVDIWSTHSCKCLHITNLLFKLFFISAKHEYLINVTHIPGLDNSIADSLFHLQVTQFHRLAIHVNFHPTTIPQEAWNF